MQRCCFGAVPEQASIQLYDEMLRLPLVEMWTGLSHFVGPQSLVELQFSDVPELRDIHQSVARLVGYPSLVGAAYILCDPV